MGAEARIDMRSSKDWLKEKTSQWNFPVNIRVCIQYIRHHCFSKHNTQTSHLTNCHKGRFAAGFMMAMPRLAFRRSHKWRPLSRFFSTPLMRMKEDNSRAFKGAEAHRCLLCFHREAHLQVNVKRDEALEILSQEGVLLVLCSLIDNMPYVVAEAAVSSFLKPFTRFKKCVHLASESNFMWLMAKKRKA